ncbi:hypothetical protein NC652_000461 [Populus alba x Populus x berolinensis]|nr:hypothetical protein NC652_000461 [Populus alba x Populus x berolinensis]
MVRGKHSLGGYVCGSGLGVRINLRAPQLISGPTEHTCNAVDDCIKKRVALAVDVIEQTEVEVERLLNVLKSGQR